MSVNEPTNPFLDEQQHVQALLESTRGELQTAIQQLEYYRNKTTEFSIANDKFAELSRYTLGELRHVLRLISDGDNFAPSTARAHVHGLIRRFELGSKYFQYDENPSPVKRA